MSLDTQESVQAAFGALTIGQEILKDAQALPAKEVRVATDYGEIIGAAPGGPIALVLAEIEDPVHNLADLIPMLGLEPDGNLGRVLRFADDVIRDVND